MKTKIDHEALVKDFRANPRQFLSQLAAKYNCSRERVRQILLKHKVYRPRKAWTNWPIREITILCPGCGRKVTKGISKLKAGLLKGCLPFVCSISCANRMRPPALSKPRRLDHSKAIALLRQGLPPKAVAQRLGISRRSVHFILYAARKQGELIYFRHGKKKEASPSP